MLDCAVPTITDSANNLSGKLTAIITYKTRYTKPCGSPVFLKFGLGEDIKVNAIIGIPQLKIWELLINLKENKCVSPYFNLWFPIEFNNAATGLPPNVLFTEANV